MIQQLFKWVKTALSLKKTNHIKTLCPKCRTVCLNEIRRGEPANIVFARNKDGDLLGVYIKYKCQQCNTIYAIPLENVNKPETWIDITDEKDERY
jgi:phage FluMu protein Com